MRTRASGTKSEKIVHLDEACKTQGCFLTGFPRHSKLFRVTRKKERKKEVSTGERGKLKTDNFNCRWENRLIEINEKIQRELTFAIALRYFPFSFLLYTPNILSTNLLFSIIIYLRVLAYHSLSFSLLSPVYFRTAPLLFIKFESFQTADKRLLRETSSQTIIKRRKEKKKEKNSISKSFHHPAFKTSIQSPSSCVKRRRKGKKEKIIPLNKWNRMKLNKGRFRRNLNVSSRRNVPFASSFRCSNVVQTFNHLVFSLSLSVSPSSSL